MTALIGETAWMVFGNEAIARRAGIGLRHLHHLRSKGKGPPASPLEIGKMMFLAIGEEALDAWIAERKEHVRRWCGSAKAARDAKVA